jgi:hypothetical protein
MPDDMNIPALVDLVEEEVEVEFDGTFQHGRISIDNETIPLNLDGAGRKRVRLFPPHVDVVVTLVAPAPARWRFTITINGNQKKERGTFEGGKIAERFQYPFSDFNL